MRLIVAAVMAVILLLPATSAAQEEERDMDKLEGKHCAVEYTPSLEAYARAFAVITDEAWEAYAELFSLPLPEPLRIYISLLPEKGEHYAHLFTDGKESFMLGVGSEKKLFAPENGGSYNIYGICHEMGHIAMYSRMSRVPGLPPGIGEGWAHYTGSVVTSHVFTTLGESVYPDPHNYHESGGMPRLLEQFRACQESGKWGDTTRVAKVMCDIEQKYGREVLGEAMNRALAHEPSGQELMPLFAEELVRITGDAGARNLIPEQCLKTEFTVRTAYPDITQEWLYYGEKLDWKDGALRLSYDDGEMNGQKSISGSGHALIFHQPDGKWLLNAIEFYGCRYGITEQPPDDEFTVFVCDEDFEVIGEYPSSYTLFPERGEWKWQKIEFQPIDVPEFFYVLVEFDPAATKGIYMALDDSVPRSHSRTAYPGAHLIDVEDVCDWMIRAYLMPGDKETERRGKCSANDLRLNLKVLREKALADVLRPDEQVSFEPYPDDPEKVTSLFMSYLLKGDKLALAFVTAESETREWAADSIRGWRERADASDFAYIGARLLKAEPDSVLYSQFGRFTVEKHKLGDICVLAWYSFPSDTSGAINVNTRRVALRIEEGKWKVTNWSTACGTIEVDADVSVDELVRYLEDKFRNLEEEQGE